MGMDEVQIKKKVFDFTLLMHSGQSHSPAANWPHCCNSCISLACLHLQFDPTRGEGSFGILAFGACGYTNVPAVRKQLVRTLMCMHRVRRMRTWHAARKPQAALHER